MTAFHPLSLTSFIVGQQNSGIWTNCITHSSTVIHCKFIFLKPGFIEEMLIRGESKNRQKKSQVHDKVEGVHQVNSSPIGTGSEGLLLLNKAALPFTKEMESR